MKGGVMAWYNLAACRDAPTALFFPTNTDQSHAAAAKRICATCPVMAECLEDALSSQMDFGVWGGTTAEERRRLLGRHRLVATTACRLCGAPVVSRSRTRPQLYCKDCRALQAV
jgi:WhiB family redox-sensing transcriptional regulator